MLTPEIGFARHRGIYRLADFLYSERPDLMLLVSLVANRKEVPRGLQSRHSTDLHGYGHDAVEASHDRPQRISPQQ